LLGFVPGFVKIHETQEGESRSRTVWRLRVLQAFVAGQQKRFGFGETLLRGQKLAERAIGRRP
jgi:hypothetical protein